VKGLRKWRNFWARISANGCVAVAAGIEGERGGGGGGGGGGEEGGEAGGGGGGVSGYEITLK
jgi:hypothetical protein